MAFALFIQLCTFILVNPKNILTLTPQALHVYWTIKILQNATAELPLLTRELGLMILIRKFNLKKKVLMFLRKIRGKNT